MNGSATEAEPLNEALDSASEAYLAVLEYGQDVMLSPGMCAERRFMQHGVTTTYEHSVSVAERAVSMAMFLGLERKVDMRSLVVAGLLHDYFLYDWHDREEWHRMHGLIHGRIACANAMRDFGTDVVNDVVADSITNHMYPLTKNQPKYLEGWLVSFSDKMCATAEAMDPERFRRVRREGRRGENGTASGVGDGASPVAWGGRSGEVVPMDEPLPPMPSVGAMTSTALTLGPGEGFGAFRAALYRTILALRSR